MDSWVCRTTGRGALPSHRPHSPPQSPPPPRLKKGNKRKQKNSEKKLKEKEKKKEIEKNTEQNQTGAKRKKCWEFKMLGKGTTAAATAFAAATTDPATQSINKEKR